MLEKPLGHIIYQWHEDVGRFIYMDLSQLIGDVRAGLLSLVLEQVVAGSLKLLKLAKFSSCHINI